VSENWAVETQSMSKRQADSPKYGLVPRKRRIGFDEDATWLPEKKAW
jgi:hypothetical protein